MFIVTIVALALVMPVLSIDRSQVSSDRERAFLCDQISVLRRSGRFRPRILHREDYSTGCIKIPPSLDAGMIGWLRDQMRDELSVNEDTGMHSVYIYYDTPGEITLRNRRIAQCVKKASDNGEDETAQLKCLSRYRMIDDSVPHGSMCFRIVDPVRAWDDMRGMLQCHRLVSMDVLGEELSEENERTQDVVSLGKPQI